MLRDYQEDAVNAGFAAIKDSVLKALIEMATGAGKSHVIAAIAKRLFEYTGQRTIVIAPKGELVKQNASKFRAEGLPCSIFSAKAGEKNLDHPVVFATPGTLINALHLLQGKVAAVINDEADGVTNQIKDIIDHLRNGNPDLRLLGLTATPYRTGEGYIFRVNEDGQHYPCKNPFYDKRVYRIGTRELIDRGFLVDVKTAPVPIAYDTSTLKRDRRGKFTQASIDQTYLGKGRRTSDIVADMVARHQYYRACLVFCASRLHAKEVMASLPPGKFRYIDGDTPTKERADILSRFKAGLIPYLVNVDVLTVGTDLPVCDHIAILRRTESDRLLQQIIGRGLRLYPGKEHCLLSDYAGNLDPFTESGCDIFTPEIKAKETKDKIDVLAPCPKCHYQNVFSGRPNPERLEINANGYFVDLAGDVMEMEVYQGESKPPLKVPFAAHYGRRCNGYHQRGPKGRLVRCSHTWLDKKCPKCEGSNDIAARQCRHCGKELTDPNRYLSKFAAEVVSTPDGWRMGKPKKAMISEYTADSGKRLILLSLTVVGRATPIQIFMNPFSTSPSIYAQWEQFLLEGFGDDQITVKEMLNRRKRFILPVAVKWKSKGSSHPIVNLMWRMPT